MSPSGRGAGHFGPARSRWSGLSAAAAAFCAGRRRPGKASLLTPRPACSPRPQSARAASRPAPPPGRCGPMDGRGLGPLPPPRPPPRRRPASPAVALTGRPPPPRTNRARRRAHSGRGGAGRGAATGSSAGQWRPHAPANKETRRPMRGRGRDREPRAQGNLSRLGRWRRWDGTFRFGGLAPTPAA